MRTIHDVVPCECGCTPVLFHGRFKGMSGIAPRHIYYLKCFKLSDFHLVTGPTAFNENEAYERWNTMRAALTLTL